MLNVADILTPLFSRTTSLTHAPIFIYLDRQNPLILAKRGQEANAVVFGNNTAGTKRHYGRKYEARLY